MLIDANIVLRHVLADHAELSPRANSIMEPIRLGQRRALLLHAVLAECVYVLQRKSGIDRAAIASRLLLVCGYKGMIGESLQIAKRALRTYAASNISFVDALLACTASESGQGLLTFDRDLVKLVSRLAKP
jgi:predicted nucleic-acid-binding protein